MQTFVAEVMANVRANVASLGGNGLVSYRMNQCVLMCNPHKNQVCCPQYHLVHCRHLTGVHTHNFSSPETLIKVNSIETCGTSSVRPSVCNYTPRNELRRV